MGSDTQAAGAHLGYVGEQEQDAGVQAGAEADEATRGPNLFGTGFALRLVAAEARAAGGHLVRRKELLNLFLPIMPQAHGNHIEGQAGEISGSADAAAIKGG